MKRHKIILSERTASVATKKGKGKTQRQQPPVASKQTYVTATTGWDAAHQYLEKNVKKAGGLNYVEPEIDNELFVEPRPSKKIVSKAGTDGYLRNWPRPVPGADVFVWHLGDNFSQLAAARNKVAPLADTTKRIKIAHIDTGYEEGHPCLPEFMSRGTSFIDDEIGKPAKDERRGSFQEQQGHGMATMSILAGGRLKNTDTGDRYEGLFGGIPFAEIIPIRICDTVALIRSNSFPKAIDYAIEQGCEVITMSMAGAPTSEWADAVNKAYEAGVFLVTAAGNSWVEGGQKLLPKRLLYPARWERVVAATGVTCENQPYIFKAPAIALKTAGGETMQGNFGPEKAMRHAIAAYTPNVSWATMNDSGKKIYFTLDGGGTSSATPQVAAAAALWISYHRKSLDKLVGSNPADQWKKVEAVRYALFESAGKGYRQYKKYLGNGTLKAYDALDFFPGDSDLKKSGEAKVTMDGVLDLLGLLLRIKSKTRGPGGYQQIKNDMYTTEVVQLLHSNSALHFLLDYDENKKWTAADKKKAKQLLLRSKGISTALKKKLKSR